MLGNSTKPGRAVAECPLNILRHFIHESSHGQTMAYFYSHICTNSTNLVGVSSALCQWEVESHLALTLARLLEQPLLPPQGWSVTKNFPCSLMGRRWIAWARPTSSSAKIYLSSTPLWYVFHITGNVTAAGLQTHSLLWLARKAYFSGAGWFAVILLYSQSYPETCWTPEISQYLKLSTEVNGTAPKTSAGEELGPCLEGERVMGMWVILMQSMWDQILSWD